MLNELQASDHSPRTLHVSDKAASLHANLPTADLVPAQDNIAPTGAEFHDGEGCSPGLTEFLDWVDVSELQQSLCCKTRESSKGLNFASLASQASYHPTDRSNYSRTQESPVTRFNAH